MTLAGIRDECNRGPRTNTPPRHGLEDRREEYIQFEFYRIFWNGEDYKYRVVVVMGVFVFRRPYYWDVSKTNSPLSSEK
jgi:hypothetical protein